MKRTIPVTAIIIIMMLTALSGCGLGSADIESESVFMFASTREPTTLDPSKSNSILDNEVQHAVTEGLTRTTGGTVSPGIAESWDVSDDGRVYTFYLRDAYWSDGEPVTAGDFVYSWQRLADPETGSDYAFAVWMIEGGREVNLKGEDPGKLKVKAVNDKTLKVTLVNPTAYFLGYIGNQPNFAPLRRDIVEKYGDKFASEPGKNVYSGPFELVSAEGNKYIFEKNDHFWDADNIKIEQAVMTLTEDEDEQIALFKDGQLDFAVIPNDQVREYRNEANANHYLNGTVNYCYINPYSGSDILANRNFRLALNYAINRREFNHEASDGVNKPYGAIVFPGLGGKDWVTYGEAFDVESYAYPLDGDFDMARNYLRKAMKSLGIRKAEDITVELLCSDDEEDKRAIKELKRQWHDVLEINVKLRYVNHTEMYTQVLPKGDYEIAYSGWIPDYNDPYTYLELFCSDNTSYTPYNDPELDEILDKTITETNQNKRMDLLNEAEKMLIDDGACIPLCARDVHYLLDPAIENLTLSFCNITLDWVYAEINREKRPMQKMIWNVQ